MGKSTQSADSHEKNYGDAMKRGRHTAMTMGKGYCWYCSEPLGHHIRRFCDHGCEEAFFEDDAMKMKRSVILGCQERV